MSEPSSPQVRLSESDGIAHIVIDRPKMNALNRAVLDQLAQAVRDVSRKGGPLAAVLTGAGDRAFVAGADIAEMSPMNPVNAKEFSDAGHLVCRLIEEAPCPFIAAVNGYALGGGCELALACDFIFASEKAEFGQPEVKLGLIPGFGGTQRLTRRVGAGWARQLIYTGEHVDAALAERIGLVNRLFPPDELQPKTHAVAKIIAKNGPLAVTASKRAILRGGETDLLTGCELEAQAFAVLFGSEDQKEGTRAFLEKRPPSFKGR